MMATTNASRRRAPSEAEEYSVRLERATRGLFALNVSVLEQMEGRVGLAPLRALQALDRRGPCLVGELGDELGVAASTASRLSDRLDGAGLITRCPAPSNRRSTLLELTDAGRGVLDELIALRVGEFRAIAQQMNNEDRVALIRGALAFTDVQQRMSDQNGKQRGMMRRGGG